MTKLAVRVSAMLLGAAIILGAGASIARADELARVTVPFEFSVGGTTLPAGSYLISRQTNQPNLVHFTTVDGKREALTMTSAGSSLASFDNPQLGFERIGGQYRLRKITFDRGGEILFRAE